MTAKKFRSKIKRDTRIEKIMGKPNEELLNVGRCCVNGMVTQDCGKVRLWSGSEWKGSRGMADKGQG